MKIRLAASQAISRPTFGQFSSAKDYSAAQSNTPVVTDAGNPNLKPVSADQADVSLEYYPSNRLALTVAAFYKHLTNFVTTQAVPFTLVPTDQVAGAPANFPFTELTYVNGDSAKVYGIEVGGQYFLDNGLGVQANATYNRSRAEREGRPTVNLEDAVPFQRTQNSFMKSTASMPQSRTNTSLSSYPHNTAISTASRSNRRPTTSWQQAYPTTYFRRLPFMHRDQTYWTRPLSAFQPTAMFLLFTNTPVVYFSSVCVPEFNI